jgi:arabinan endo-1,5-alpha-L-arabinosidase
MMYHEGWYYLLGTHATCCAGPNSTYNIIVGRSKTITGPYMDNVGRSMLEGGGRAVATSDGNLIGPGHFGRIMGSEKGVDKMSFHWEADMDMGGRSTLGVRPIVWKNGWPIMGEIIKAGTYAIQSERRGFGLELAVDWTSMQTAGGGFGGGGGGNNAPIKPAPLMQLADAIKGWPTGDIAPRLNEYISRPHQRWSITPAPDSSGYLGGPYYKIVIAGTERALTATADAEVITVPKFTGAPEQLWRIDQLTDGTYRIMPKVVPNSKEKLALVSSGDSTPTLAKFNMDSDNSKWNFKLQ